MSQVTLVPNEHDDNIGVGMISKLLEPPRHVVVRLVLTDIVDEKRTHRATVVCRGDGPIALLSSGIPDLSLDCLCVNLDGSCGELNTDGRLGVKVELIPCETTQQVGLPDSGVANQDD